MKKFVAMIIMLLLLVSSNCYAGENIALNKCNIETTNLVMKVNNLKTSKDASGKYVFEDIYPDKHKIPIIFYQNIIKDTIILKNKLNADFIPITSGSDLVQMTSLKEILDVIEHLAFTRMNLRTLSDIIFVDKVTPDTYTDNVILQKLVYEENAFELLLMDKYKNKVKQNLM